MLFCESARLAPSEHEFEPQCVHFCTRFANSVVFIVTRGFLLKLVNMLKGLHAQLWPKAQGQ